VQNNTKKMVNKRKFIALVGFFACKYTKKS